MSRRIRAARVIAKRQIYETLINPGFSLALALGVLLGYLLVRGFVGAVDSSGFNSTLNSLYDFIGRALEGALGKTFVDKLFADGPFLFAFAVSFSPVFLFLAVSSVFRFGLEKNAGGIELISYGPADGTSFLVASFARDVLFTSASILFLLVFLGVSGAMNNLVLGSAFLRALLVMFFLSFSFSAYGILVSTLTGNAASALALYFAILVLFLLILLGSFAIVGGYARNLASAAAWVVKWFSPFFYGTLCIQAGDAGKPLAFIGGLAGLAALAGTLLWVSHLVISTRGVRA
jgi:hypothetical protein